MHMSVSLGKVHGPEAAIELLEQFPVPQYYLYYALLADAYSKANRSTDAVASFERALELTRNNRERALLEERLSNVRQ
jgi:predicted RNA polymerase sigma factor